MSASTTPFLRSVLHRSIAFILYLEVVDVLSCEGRKACSGFVVHLEQTVMMPPHIGQVIELDYSEADQDSTGEEAANTEKQLVYYQLDLGLNHVTRLWSDPISR